MADPEGLTSDRGGVADVSLSPRARGDGPLPCFDGLRALAALSVVAFHAAVTTAAFREPRGRYLLSLNVGVWVFFTVSGFLLYLPFVGSHVRDTRVNIRTYFVRRFARIFPGYWVALLVITLVLGRAQVAGVGNWLLHLSLLQFYDPKQTPSGLTQAWTLTVELSFYIFLPVYGTLIGLLVRRYRVLRVEVAGVVVLITVGVLSHAFLPGLQWKRVLPNHLDAFGVGMLLAVLIAVPLPHLASRILERAGRAAWPWWLGSAAAFLLIPEFSYPGSINEVASGMCRAGCGLFLVVPAVLGGRRPTPIRRVLASRVAVYLGLVSYGIYLWHPTLLDVVQDQSLSRTSGTGAMIVLLALTLPLIVAVASASWYLIERPCVGWSRHIRLGPPEERTPA